VRNKSRITFKSNEWQAYEWYTYLQFARLCSPFSPIYHQVHIIFVSTREISKTQTYESSFWLHDSAWSIPKIESVCCTSRTFRSDSNPHGGLALPSPNTLCPVSWYYSSSTLAMISRLVSRHAKSWILCRILTMDDLNTICEYISESVQGSLRSHHIPYLITNFLFLAHSSNPGTIRVEDRSGNLSARNLEAKIDLSTLQRRVVKQKWKMKTEMKMSIKLGNIGINIRLSIGICWDLSNRRYLCIPVSWVIPNQTDRNRMSRHEGVWEYSH